MMCMNNKKNNKKYTNILCRGSIMYFLIFVFLLKGAIFVFWRHILFCTLLVVKL